MYTPYDDKGKIFTDVIQKRPVDVIIQTSTHRVHGTIHVRPNERVKDEIDRADLFLPVTSASIYDQQNNLLFETGFMVIHRDSVVWLTPLENLKSSPEDE